MKRTITGILGAIILLANGQALAATTPTQGTPSLTVSAQIHLSRIEPGEPVTCPAKARKAFDRDADGNEIDFGGASD